MADEYPQHPQRQQLYPCPGMRYMREFHATLNEVPWRTVGSQQGKCEHVPDAIEALISPDSGLRKAGYWRLDICLVVQGGLFDGAFYVVPFCVAGS
jgi:hypothetical protein